MTSSGSTLPTAVAAALAAANAGNTEDFLRSFADDGAVDDWGRVFRGRAAIQDWSDGEFIGKQVTLEVTAARTEGDTTTVSARVGGNGFNGPSDFAFTVAGDRLALMRITG
ncbi:SnoaL-like domain-containing protein [Streptomyces sp. DvalAA-14]|uniref:nuclear transport factor 2 family protein n=1 Tax=unclassified Streptomyces TaxID=2593676 RepID=UPI00081BC2BA|nr:MULTISPECIES: nuclear transport factor 2 family protein [unclassified Streptomyces]MYS19428.1 nuclear transport factor 2 family protein [Streptomyces sp. SID4948]SCD44213.1 SnoaL-like domain-containing protein [Streptomyces sp. DvalAA-14]